MQPLRPEDPQLTGRYRLLARLGSGGMGRVYLGQSPGGRLVAIKVIRAELAESAEFRRRFAREVTAARTVGGMFTAPVVDANPDPPQPWLVTAYIDGLSLADAVASRGPLPVASVQYLAAGLAEGLGAIHAAGLVHRDLKPSNVLLASDGPRIIDFGISRAMDATGLTMSGLVVGSPGFMAPEQAEGGAVGPASDIFSLGALLAFSATGEGPFGEGTTPALLYRVVHGTPSTARLPGPVRPLIEQCLSKDPQQRPTSEQILDRLGVSAPTAGWLPWPVAQASRGDLPADIAGPLTADAAAVPPAGPWRTPTELAGPSASAAAEPVTVGPPSGAPAGPGRPSGATWPDHADGPGGPPRRHRVRRLLLAAAAVIAVLALAGGAAAVVTRYLTGERPAAAANSSLASPQPSSAPAPRASPSAPQGSAAAPQGSAPAPQGKSSAPQASPAQPPSTAPPSTQPPSSAPPSPAPPSSAPAAPGGTDSPRAVVQRYVAAINQHDWPLVWQLGGKNLGQSYSQMVDGYSTTSKDVITSIQADGDNVAVSIDAYTGDGSVQAYNLQYEVVDGVIVSGSGTKA